MVFNQNFQLSWNAIWRNLSTRIGEDIIKKVEYVSPFSKFISNMENGNYVQESFINKATVYLQDTVNNQAILTDYNDTVLTSIHGANVDLNIPTTSKEYVARTSYNFWENVSFFLMSLITNLKATQEIEKQKIVKQMLYNAWSYGMLDTYVVDDPTLSETNAKKYVSTLNALKDDFITEPNSRNMIYNNRLDIINDPNAEKLTNMAKEVPYVIMFNDNIRDIEITAALDLVFGKFRTGNDNQDFSDRLIKLNELDFPKSIPPKNRSEVTGSNITTKDINFFENPITPDGKKIFSGVPKAGTRPIAFILEIDSLIMRSTLDVQTEFTNQATLSKTSRQISRLIMSLSGFEKICCIAVDDTKKNIVIEDKKYDIDDIVERVLNKINVDKDVENVENLEDKKENIKKVLKNEKK